MNALKNLYDKHLDNSILFYVNLNTVKICNALAILW